MYLAMYLQRIPYPQIFILFPASQKNFYPQNLHYIMYISHCKIFNNFPLHSVQGYVRTYSWWAGLQVCSSVTDHHYTTAQYHYKIMHTLLICIHHYISIHYYMHTPLYKHTLLYMHTPLYAYTTIYAYTAIYAYITIRICIHYCISHTYIIILHMYHYNFYIYYYACFTQTM